MKMKILALLFCFVSINFALNATDASLKTQKKILIVYYSWSGNTAYAANQIKKTCGSCADIFEIKPVKPYPTTYKECVKQAKSECKKQFAPDIITPLPNLTKYDIIFIGSPNWWGTMAPPVLSFIKKNNFTNKTVVLFITHDGGGLQQCSNDFNSCFNNTTNILKPEAFLGKNIKKLDSKLAEFAKQRIENKNR